jgi:hypothetical protein
MREVQRADTDVAGLDHGVGHSLLLLYDAKAPNYQKSQDFKGLGHYPCNIILSSFRIIIKLHICITI